MRFPLDKPRPVLWTAAVLAGTGLAFMFWWPLFVYVWRYWNG
jgi:hypothetical protein